MNKITLELNMLNVTHLKFLELIQLCPFKWIVCLPFTVKIPENPSGWKVNGTRLF